MFNRDIWPQLGRREWLFDIFCQAAVTSKEMFNFFFFFPVVTFLPPYSKRYSECEKAPLCILRKNLHLGSSDSYNLSILKPEEKFLLVSKQQFNNGKWSKVGDRKK